MTLPPLVVVTDRTRSRLHLPEQLARALEGVPQGSLAVWFRDRDLPPAERLTLAREVARRTREAGAPLWVSTDASLAQALGADALQVPAGLPCPTSWTGPWGAAVHDRRELEHCLGAGASWAVVSPVHAVPGKAPPLGLPGLRALVEAAGTLPVLALGGLGPGDALALRKAGTAGMVVQRALLGTDDATAAAAGLLAAWQDGAPG